MENPIKMDDLGVPLFLETPIFTKPRPSYKFETILRPKIHPNPKIHFHKKSAASHIIVLLRGSVLGVFIERSQFFT